MNKNISQIENLANNLQASGLIISRQGIKPSTNPTIISTSSQTQEQSNSAKSTTQSSIDSEKLIESLKTKYRRERRKNDPDLRKMVLVKAEYFKIKNDFEQNTR
jgi:hypothetical protein